MLLNIIQLLAPAALDSWLNYPGLEVWKFLDLGIFLGVAVFLLKRRMRDALEARRESIKAELLKLQQTLPKRENVPQVPVHHPQAPLHKHKFDHRLDKIESALNEIEERIRTL